MHERAHGVDHCMLCACVRALFGHFMDKWKCRSLRSICTDMPQVVQCDMCEARAVRWAVKTVLTMQYPMGTTRPVPEVAGQTLHNELSEDVKVVIGLLSPSVSALTHVPR